MQSPVTSWSGSWRNSDGVLLCCLAGGGCQAQAHVVDDEFGHGVQGHLRGVQAEVVGACGSPALVGVEVVEFGTHFVEAVGHGSGFVDVGGLASADYALGAGIEWGVDEYIHHIGEITQDVVGAASHNHA